jgi:hypothetical protein
MFRGRYPFRGLLDWDGLPVDTIHAVVVMGRVIEVVVVVVVTEGLDSRELRTQLPFPLKYRGS